MLSNEKIDYLQGYFYGWEYCVQNGLSPTMTHEEIQLLRNLFWDLEDLKKENKTLMSKLEDVELAKTYGEDIERFERGESRIEKFNDIAELFDKLEGKF